METKFKVGDTIMRAEYQHAKSAFLRDEMKVTSIIEEEWYMCEDCNGKTRMGLVGVVDSCFIKA